MDGCVVGASDRLCVAVAAREVMLGGGRNSIILPRRRGLCKMYPLTHPLQNVNRYQQSRAEQCSRVFGSGSSLVSVHLVRVWMPVSEALCRVVGIPLDEDARPGVAMVKYGTR